MEFSIIFLKFFLTLPLVGNRYGFGKSYLQCNHLFSYAQNDFILTNAQLYVIIMITIFYALRNLFFPHPTRKLDQIEIDPDCMGQCQPEPNDSTPGHVTHLSQLNNLTKKMLDLEIFIPWLIKVSFLTHTTHHQTKVFREIFPVHCHTNTYRWIYAKI